MRPGDDDQNDLVGRLQLADAVDDEHVHHVPAVLRLGDDVLERPLGHAGIVLEGHLRHRSAVVGVAADTDETRYRAYLGSIAAQRGDLGAGVEVLGLDAHRHS